MNNQFRRLPLAALRTFEVAARLQSFKLAAQELSVTPTTVSNQIRKLERDWGCQLFIRKTRQLVLTEVGRSLAQTVNRAFGDIKAEIEAHVTMAKKTVTLEAGPIFASRWLIPRLNRFRRQHPDIELVLHHGSRISVAENMNADAAVDWGEGNWPGLESTHLLNIRYLPVLSPHLAKQKGGFDKPIDLLRFTILHHSDRSEWDDWLNLAGLPESPGLNFIDETTIEDSNVILQAAIDGHGVALGIFPFIQTEVDEGRLICPMDITLTPKRTYHLLTRPGMRKNPDVETVCRWLEEEAANTPSN
ncbi:LysR substrate-binding domain-containing protein [Oceanospirillaceae bacterium]|uniref:LysR substrate-binding domain-containing protein n=1 Tax=Candidatus Njordibacter sp. Uisw_058 TaxID=3230974 RepID=UPI00233A4F71|nr:LysR substrate-binding domain-containing protein [Oceanospirillaceae bacterium]MDB4535973.1 LysR substrate-binding domain-containing protein [Oceanospirillaceae bacterium]MDC0084243.1 LysR substrate-binding domain-containing protein [Oceanospirillaceae bacterium]MDC1506541.1 LysR substrate-binding domain-containing protein [Oceanospirillaceae bacterium]